PLIKMKNEAVKLAHGNYDTTFVGSGYSEVNELANTLNDAKDKLSKIDELRRDLIANVSHDLKTPLTMIKAYAEMILDISGDKKEKREEHLNVIIKEMQELSKMQAGYIVLNKYNFDLSSKVLEVMHLFDVMIHEKSFEVELNVQPDVFVYADEVKIGQVIYNFISNAFKNSDDHTKVTINLAANEDFTRFEVVDQGSGIKEEDLPYIWDRYYKIEKKFIRNHQGTGLGLAIVKAILDAHNIAYGVESEYGKGSIFYFEISNYYDENDL
ncbi:MAG: HAMP domain-containing sensor histidine kinase, partial [Erysipelotrichaceae bacterium]|nr:HAMP domain-containing sensor histidine kinase [Erysipelotrichaceae bacterium]